uniref:Cytochrome c biogenesis protein CcsA n=1 Tax=Rotundella rotunda TaxID=1357779 RepID=A0A140GIN1_9CHLO|nr:heme attachment to plastid cytochrome c [Rotundella rotunda]
MLFSFENFFSNSSFVCLFISMIFYWVQTGFLLKNRWFGTLTMILANFSLLSLLVLRWKESGHFPLSNLYESLIFLSWSFTTIHLIIEHKMALSPLPFFSKTSSSNLNITPTNLNPNFLGAITSPTALFTSAFAAFCLPTEMQTSSPLVPALQSNWLMMHVSVMILSYGALICGSLLSIAFLILTKNMPDLGNENLYPMYAEKTEKDYPSKEGDKTSALTFSFPEQRFSKGKLANDLDNLSYRILGIGFPFLTIGILSGAVWANEAWGSYWSWDPKETWAFLTWLVFAIYLHTRFTKGWQGKKPAIIASLGFLTVWVCYLGVNLIGDGLHSYGFFAKNSF